VKAPLRFNTVRKRSILNSVLFRLSRWLIVLTLTLSLGAHWMFLQSVAWVGMVVKYSHDATITKALGKTFDGQHPCKLCKVVQQGKAAEKKQDTQKPEIKMDKFPPVDRAFTLCPPLFRPTLFSAPLPATSRIESPPIPPPERA
jgi:hypothetical protein